MRQRFVVATVVLLVGFVGLGMAEEVTIVAPTSEAAEGLDLHAVSELFKEVENLEAFERALNDPDVGVNNLDLDSDGEVDFIRIVEEVAGETHVVILQVPLAENEFQDVATIEIEKSGDDAYNLQVHGNEVIYGPSYYLVPAHVSVHWPIVHWIYRPHYRPYRSAFYFGFHPHWWRPYHPVTVNVYRTRTVRFTSRATFSVTRTGRVRSVTKVKYTPRSSTRVTKRTAVAAGPGKATVTRKGVKKTANPKAGSATSVKKGTKKTARSGRGAKKAGKKTTKKTTKKKAAGKKGARKTKTKKKKR